jgi:hypothetical protein
VPAPGPAARADKSIAALGSELWELVVSYARQETIEPIKGVGRYVAFGLAGSLALGIGLVLLALAGLRALQTETTVFDDGWSWAPYLITLAGTGLIVALAISAMGRRRRRRS